jgi:YHS domain-containing protein
MSDIGNSLAEGWWMFFDTFWALVLGFTLSGAVQAFVSRAAMQRSLGDHRPRTVAKASFFGMVSSSCSYAASALAKSLFARGADFTSAQAFMFASTNLVFELGIVLWLLIGWQFAAAEFVGGAIMIAALSLVLPRAIPAPDIEAARVRLNAATTNGAAGDHDTHAGHGEQPPEQRPWRQRIRSRAGWSDASGYTISDLTMLRKELVAGFVIAGFAAVVVPTSVWRAVFISGHGFWSSLENVIVGPFIAIISFVCSVGNVPLAAALWQGGISFGGVISFVFADLIALPLLLIYRKYYGTGLTLRLLAVFWAVMSAAGLVTEYLFKAVGGVPANRPTGIATTHFGWNYTTILNVIAVVGFAVVYGLYRSSRSATHHDAAASPYAKDVVCGMQVEKAHAPATAEHAGRTHYFCSDRCEHRFTAEPNRFTGGEAADSVLAGPPGQMLGMPRIGPAIPASATDTAVDPVCGMTVDAVAATGQHSYAGRVYHFCSTGCRDAFTLDPLAHLLVARDPVCGMDVRVTTTALSAQHGGLRYLFCGPGCQVAFRTEPYRFLGADEGATHH